MLPRKAKEEKEKWWNEWPLEGPENRWAVYITKVLSKSTLIVGWDDERMEQKALAALAKSMGKEVKDLTQEDVPETISFGFQDMIAEEITKRLLNIEIASGDDNDGKKVTLRDVGGGKFVEQSAEPNSIRETDLYKLALENLHWQRDNYLVGKDYADTRKRLRQMGQDISIERAALDRTILSYQFPFDATALGNIQMESLGSWFIPSKTVHYSLLPIVLELPLGSMYVPILKATTSLIPLSQSNLDSVLKTQVLHVLNNQEWRDLIKKSTKGYIANTYVDARRAKEE